MEVGGGGVGALRVEGCIQFFAKKDQNYEKAVQKAVHGFIPDQQENVRFQRTEQDHVIRKEQKKEQFYT